MKMVIDNLSNLSGGKKKKKKKEKNQLQAVCNTRSIFKWSTADLNSVFFLLDQLP